MRPFSVWIFCAPLLAMLASCGNLGQQSNPKPVAVTPIPIPGFSTSDGKIYDWKTLKMGGGGVLSGIQATPDGTLVTRTDTYGAYLWKGTEWQQLVTSTAMPSAFVKGGGNFEGVYEIQAAPSNSSVMYMLYVGQLFKTTNKGATWTLTNFSKVTADPNDGFRTRGQKLAVDPINPNVVYVGTPTNGLFVTKDGGASFQNVGGVPVAQAAAGGGNPGYSGIAFAPSLGSSGGKTKTIFVPSYGNGVYESTDAGATWTFLAGGPVDVGYAVVASDGTYLVASDTYSQVKKFSNGTWSTLLTSFNYWVTAVAINPVHPLEFVAIGSNSSPNVSYDGGITWSGFGSTQALSPEIPWLASTGGTSAHLGAAGIVFNPLVPDQLISTGGSGIWNTMLPQNHMAITPVAWTSQTVGIEQLCANEVIAPPGGSPIAANWDFGVFKFNNPDTYSTTRYTNDGIFAAGWSIDYASSTPSFIVGLIEWWSTEMSGFSTDGGQTWSKFASFPPGASTASLGGTIAASTPLNILWAPVSRNPYYTLDGGVSWNPISLPGVADYSGLDWAYYFRARTIVADRAIANTFYLYYPAHGLYRTVNGGVNWTKQYDAAASGEIAPYDYYNTQLQSVPDHAGHLFFTGGPQGTFLPATTPFMRSTDGGASWTAVPNVLEVTSFGFGKASRSGGYPAIFIAGFVNGVYGIHRSDDNAASWVQIGDYPVGNFSGIRTVTGDPAIFGRVYVGFSGSGLAYGAIRN